MDFYYVNLSDEMKSVFFEMIVFGQLARAFGKTEETLKCFIVFWVLIRY